MKQLHWTRLAAGLIAATTLVLPLTAIAQVPDRVEKSQSVTRGQSNGKGGYWINVQERTFRWVATPPISEEFKSAYIKNRDYDGITDWQWAWGSGVNKYKGDRDWNMQELLNTFGSFGWKQGQSGYGASGLQQAIAPQTSRSLGQAYRFLQIAKEMEAKGVTALSEPVVFSIQADDGVSWDYSSRNYVNVDPRTNLSILPGIQSEYFAGNQTYNQWTSIRRFTITNLTPQLALQIAKDLYAIASRCGSPVALDLDHDGKISVTGNSSAKLRSFKNAFVSEGSVRFDLEAVGRKPRYEWLKGDSDAFLINDRDGSVTRAIAKDGEVDGRVLFGNAGGYENGYYKLAKFFDHGMMLASAKGGPRPDGTIKGKELDGLALWFDRNHDAKVQAGEMVSLASLGITELGSTFRYERSADGEMLMRSYYVQNGKRHMTEDVWFAIDPADESGAAK